MNGEPMRPLPPVDLRTQDPDLGLSLLLWLADVVEEGFAAGTWQRLVIDDEGLAGRPFRKQLPGRSRPDFQVVTEPDGMLRFLASSSALFFPARPGWELARRIGSAVGWCRDLSTLDHIQVVRHVQRLRQRAAAALGIRLPETRCRFLLRVDDFPSPAAASAEFPRFHEVAREYGVPYLVAVTPFLDRGQGRTRLTDDEVEILHQCSAENVELALHGFCHRSRYRNYASELVSLPIQQLREELERADEYLTANGLQKKAFVAPFNSYNPLTVSVLAERFPILGGGPESVRSLGYRAGPSFLMGSLYLPSYRHAYDVTEAMLPTLERLAAAASGMIVPITLHWPNEIANDLHAFRRLCARLAGQTLSWREVLTRANQVKSWARAGTERIQETSRCA